MARCCEGYRRSTKGTSFRKGITRAHLFRREQGEEIVRPCPIESWTINDLRWTVATNLAALGTLPHVTERLLNDVAETIWSFAAVYNRHTCMNEMRETLYG